MEKLSEEILSDEELGKIKASLTKHFGILKPGDAMRLIARLERAESLVDAHAQNSIEDIDSKNYAIRERDKALKQVKELQERCSQLITELAEQNASCSHAVRIAELEQQLAEKEKRLDLYRDPMNTIHKIVNERDVAIRALESAPSPEDFECRVVSIWEEDEEDEVIETHHNQYDNWYANERSKALGKK